MPTLTETILQKAGLSPQKVEAALQQKKKKEDEEKQGLGSLPSGVKNTIHEATKKFAEGQTFTKEEADKISSVIQATAPPSPVISALTPEESAEGQRRMEEFETRPIEVLKESPFVKALTGESTIQFPQVGPAAAGTTPQQEEIKSVIGTINPFSLEFGLIQFLGGIVGGLEEVTRTNLPDIAFSRIESVSPTQEGIGLTGPTQLVGEVEKPSFVELFTRGFVSKVPALGGKEPLSTDPDIDVAAKITLGAVFDLGYGMVRRGAPAIAKEIDNILLTKKTTVPRSEVKKGLIELTTQRKVGATDNGLKAAQKVIDDVNDGLTTVSKALKTDSTIREKRNFIKWIRDILKKDPAPTPQVTAFLKETNNFKTATKEIVSTYQQRALDLVPTPSLFRTRTTALKPVEPGVGVGETRLPAFAKDVRSTAPDVPTPKITPEVTPPVTRKGAVRNKLAVNMLASEKVSDATKELIRTDPKTFHLKLSDDEAKAAVDGLTDEQLRSLMPNKMELTELKIGEFAGAELAKRLELQGLHDQAAQVAIDMSEVATKLGQGVQGLKYWNEWLNPQSKIRDIENKLAQLTGPERALTKKQHDRLLEGFKQEQKTRIETDSLVKEAFENPTKETIKTAKQKVKELSNQVRKTFNDTQAILPKSIAKVIGQSIQGSLLTLQSLIRNPVYNIMTMPVNVPAKISAATMDLFRVGILRAAGKTANIVGKGAPESLKKFLRENERLAAGKNMVSKFVGPADRVVGMANPKEAMIGFGEGMVSAVEAALKGPMPGDLSKIEMHTTLQPIRALASVMTGGDLPVATKTGLFTAKGKPLVRDKVKKLVEGVFGMPANVFLRGLPFGDDPIKMAYSRAIADELARLKGLKGMDKKAFIELRDFVDKESKRIIEQESAKKVFQENNKLASAVNRGMNAIADIPGIGPFLYVPAKATAPYVKTLFNVAWTYAQVAKPSISWTKGFIHASRGETRQALNSFGLAVVGTALVTAAGFFAQQEDKVINPGTSRGKERDMEYGLLKPNHFNISAIQRILKGESGKLKDGDTQVPLDAAGILGFIMKTQAMQAEFPEPKDIGRELTGAEKEMNEWMSTVNSYLGVFSEAMDETMMRESANVLRMIGEIDTPLGQSQFKRWMQNTISTISSIGMPKQLESMGRWKNKPILDLEGDTVAETVENVIRLRLSAINEELTEDMPALMDLFGQEVQRTPEDRDAFVFNMIDPIKFFQTDLDPRYDVMGKVFKATENSEVIPSEAERREGEPLVDYRKRLKQIGQQRGVLWNDLMTSDMLKKLPLPALEEILVKINKDGKSIAESLAAGEEPKTSTIIAEWDFAYQNFIDGTPATRRELGSKLAEVGKTINKSGDASKDDWVSYQKMRYTWEGVDTTKPEVVAIIKKIEDGEYDDNTISAGLQVDVRKGNISELEMKYIETQTKSEF